MTAPHRNHKKAIKLNEAFHVLKIHANDNSILRQKVVAMLVQ